mmetsp:Transcript_3835/g.7229  ORF Transcript_3835/g.7229 Transcript_3835/m.7229 type:complete len:129 (+) Transcript_3835:963-1349(+)
MAGDAAAPTVTSAERSPPPLLADDNATSETILFKLSDILLTVSHIAAVDVVIFCFCVLLCNQKLVESELRSLSCKKVNMGRNFAQVQLFFTTMGKQAQNEKIKGIENIHERRGENVELLVIFYRWKKN